MIAAVSKSTRVHQTAARHDDVCGAFRHSVWERRNANGRAAFIVMCEDEIGNHPVKMFASAAAAIEFADAENAEPEHCDL